MLDVMHFMMEEDMLHHSKMMGSDGQDTMRVSLYKDFYNRPYALSELSKARALASNSTSTVYGGDITDDMELLDDSMPVPLDPAARGAAFTRPYIPPTDFEPTADLPFGDLLDPPMSHNAADN